MEKYVVICTHKMPHGSRVMCQATTKENAEQTKTKFEGLENFRQYGPFEVIKYKDAERRKLYGD